VLGCRNGRLSEGVPVIGTTISAVAIHVWVAHRISGLPPIDLYPVSSTLIFARTFTGSLVITINKIASAPNAFLMSTLG